MSERTWAGLAGVLVAGLLAQGCTEKTCGPGEIKYGEVCAVPCESIPGALCDRDGGVLSSDGQVLPGLEAGAEGGSDEGMRDAGVDATGSDAAMDAASDAASEAAVSVDATGIDASPEVIGPRDAVSEGEAGGVDAGAADVAEAGADASPADTREACVPACTGRACGDDGCGGSCGACLAGFVCGASGQCAQRSCPDPRERGCGVVEVAAPTEAFRVGNEMYPLVSPPIEGVRVSAFGMDTHEVTVSRFRRFWEAGHAAAPGTITYPGGTVTVSGAVLEPTASGEAGRDCTWSATANPSRDSLPINCLNWATAMAFCAWDGGRLPTHAEWEYVARYRPVAGVSSPREFPWGNEQLDPAERQCEYVLKGFCPDRPMDAVVIPVGSLPGFGGFFDLFGNVGEMLADEPRRYDDPAWAAAGRMNPVLDGPHVEFAVRGAGLLGDVDTDRSWAWWPSSIIGPIAPSGRGVRCVYGR